MAATEFNDRIDSVTLGQLREFSQAKVGLRAFVRGRIPNHKLHAAIGELDVAPSVKSRLNQLLNHELVVVALDDHPMINALSKLTGVPGNLLYEAIRSNREVRNLHQLPPVSAKPKVTQMKASKSQEPARKVEAKSSSLPKQLIQPQSVPSLVATPVHLVSTGEKLTPHQCVSRLLEMGFEKNEIRSLLVPQVTPTTIMNWLQGQGARYELLRQLQTLASLPDKSAVLDYVQQHGHHLANESIIAKKLAMGDEIRRARETAGLTMTGLARKAKVKYDTIRRLEAGESYPMVQTLQRLSTALERGFEIRSDQIELYHQLITIDPGAINLSAAERAERIEVMTSKVIVGKAATSHGVESDAGMVAITAAEVEIDQPLQTAIGADLEEKQSIISEVDQDIDLLSAKPSSGTKRKPERDASSNAEQTPQMMANPPAIPVLPDFLDSQKLYQQLSQLDANQTPASITLQYGSLKLSIQLTRVPDIDLI